MKFWIMLKKELREMLTAGTIISVVVTMLIFLFMGQVMGDVMEETASQGGEVAIADEDGTPGSAQAVSLLEEMGFEVHDLSPDTDEGLLDQAAEFDRTSVLVIPAGFEAGLAAGETQPLRVITALKSFAMVSAGDGSAATAAQAIGESLSDQLLGQAVSGTDADFFKNPVSLEETTVAKGRSAQVNADILRAASMQQSIFIPIIVFILIIYASQLNVAAIANEKNDKTLETLLSAPVTRLSVLASKMCASGVLSIIMAAAYMIGLSGYMGGMMGGSEAGSMDGVAAALQTLGLQMTGGQYVLLGVQLFLSILIALALSMVLGALSKDLKAASSMMMPLTFLAMIPYFITMFLDVTSLPVIVQILLFLIPFTHTFSATGNLLFGNDVLFFGGMIYQAVLLVGIMFIAVRIFSTDMIFTVTLDFSKRRKKTVPPASSNK